MLVIVASGQLPSSRTERRVSNHDDASKPVVESSVKHERMICVSKR